MHMIFIAPGGAATQQPPPMVQWSSISFVSLDPHLYPGYRLIPGVSCVKYSRVLQE